MRWIVVIAIAAAGCAAEVGGGVVEGGVRHAVRGEGHAAAGGDLVRISDHPFDDAQPRWSPDGAQLAFTGENTRRELPKLYLAPATGGTARLAVDNLDLIPTDLAWPSPKTLRFQSGNKGTTHLFRVDLDARKVAPVTTGERAIRAADSNAATTLIYLANDFRRFAGVTPAAYLRLQQPDSQSVVLR